MAYRDPDVLLHSNGPGEGPVIRDDPLSVARLGSRWDSLGLLYLHNEAVSPDSLVRIFGAMKDRDTDRQIGDRRGRNALESKIKGPSSDLPNGSDLCDLSISPSLESLSISITDRKDFYHQFKATNKRAVSNTIGPCVPLSSVCGTTAYAAFCARTARSRASRGLFGDRLRSGNSSLLVDPDPDHVWVSFASVLQGDHAGVEIATEAHTHLLQQGGLLSDGVQMRASCPLKAEKAAEGLVIDDYFAISIQSKSCPSNCSRAKHCYDTAQKIYDVHGLAGSPHKDLIAQDEGRVIGAYINASERATRRNIVTVAAPIRKRLVLSHLSLQVAQLAYTTDALHLCLLGGWTSALAYRRPVMSVLQESFLVVDIDSFDRNNPKLVSLSRSVANELVLLAVLMPLISSDIAAPFDRFVYCTDASNDRGACLRAPVSPLLSALEDRQNEGGLLSVADSGRSRTEKTRRA